MNVRILFTLISLTFTDSYTINCQSQFSCSWSGHCLGAPCLTYDDCFDYLTCTKGKCSMPVWTQPKVSHTIKYSKPTKQPSAPSVSASTNKVIRSGLIGEKTHFDDNEYQCWEWNGKAKDAMSKGYYFAATNFKLVSPQKSGDFKLKCGGPAYLCARSASGREYQIIDWCNPNGVESCTVAEEGHLDILVGAERNNNICIDSCDGYNAFQDKESWDLVVCSNPAIASNYKKVAYTGDQSEFGRR